MLLLRLKMSSFKNVGAPEVRVYVYVCTRVYDEANHGELQSRNIITELHLLVQRRVRTS